jgi:hypothetical protein
MRALSRYCTRDRAVLFVLLAALSISFYYGWFHDHSHPLGGHGWGDQRLYTNTAHRLADLSWPSRAMLHHPPGYAFLAVLPTYLWRNDPFWIVSYALLIGSAAFCYRGARAFYNEFFAAIFLVSMFMWDGRGRSLTSVSDMFTVPWNNQVLFFAFAFFFWLCATRSKRPVGVAEFVAMGAIVGFLTTTREESILFMVPLAVIFLWYRREPIRRWLLVGGATVVAALPGLVVKQHVLGSIFSTGPGRRGGTYASQASNTFIFGKLTRNVRDVLVDADLARVHAHRQALFEATPWLWLGVIGIVLVLVLKRFDLLTKIFVVMSLLLIAFYLSGGHVSASKLKYHCLRYITPGYIALHFGVIVVLGEAWYFVTGRRSAAPGAVDITDPSEPVEDTLEASVTGAHPGT